MAFHPGSSVGSAVSSQALPNDSPARPTDGSSADLHQSWGVGEGHSRLSAPGTITAIDGHGLGDLYHRRAGTTLAAARAQDRMQRALDAARAVQLAATPGLEVPDITVLARPVRHADAADVSGRDPVGRPRHRAQLLLAWSGCPGPQRDRRGGRCLRLPIVQPASQASAASSARIPPCCR
jgi:hypothetical protein